MSNALQALVAKQEGRNNWEKAIDQLQWRILNSNSIPAHERSDLLKKADVLRRQPELAVLEKQKGFTFHQPFGKHVDDLHWEAIKELAARLSNEQ